MKPSAGRYRPAARGASWWLLAALMLLGFTVFSSTFELDRASYRYLLALDITQSMNVVDMRVGDSPASRLDFAKAAARAAIDSLPCGSEIGLAVFTAHRTFVMFTPVEVCDHFLTLTETLEAIDWRIAWAASSEVSKGLFSAIAAARDIGRGTRLAFMTDGHEAPPLNPDLPPRFGTDASDVEGLIVGIGGVLPSRIPHLDDDDNVVGYWRRDEVMQIDVYSQGRPATEAGEAMAGVDAGNVARRIASGREHLSSLRETHLQTLALQTGLDYRRVTSPAGFAEAVRQSRYAGRARAPTDVDWIPASAAFCCLAYWFVVAPLRRDSRPA